MSLLDILLDPERRQTAREEQSKLEAVMGQRVMRQPAQAKYFYGVARERMALDQLDRRGPDVTPGDDPVLFLQLAEGLMLQGKFEAAAELAPEGAHKLEYAARARAVDAINEQQCDDPLKRPVRAHGISPQAQKEHAGQVAAAIERQELLSYLWKKSGMASEQLPSPSA